MRSLIFIARENANNDERSWNRGKGSDIVQMAVLLVFQRNSLLVMMKYFMMENTSLRDIKDIGYIREFMEI